MAATAELAAPAETAIRPVNGQFPPGEFVTVRDVPIFAEHQTTAKNGRRLIFGRRELQAVCDNCNRRIRETGDYAVVSILHTTGEGEQPSDPEVVGFAGPFRVDRIGATTGRPRFAILADMHYFNKSDVLEQVRRHPRRSPELWLADRYEDMFLDPIALLGAQAPRLDLGLFYSATGDGQQVEKYQAEAASPAAGNVFIPSDDAGKKNRKHYEAPNPNMENQAMPLSPEDVKQIVDAIAQTDWAQWCQSKMQAESQANATVSDSETSVDAPKPAGVSPSAAPAGGPPEELAGKAADTNEPPPISPESPAHELAETPADEEREEREPYEGEEDDVEAYRKWRRRSWHRQRRRKYAAGQPSLDGDADAGTTPVKEEKPGKEKEQDSPSKFQKPGEPERFGRALDGEMLRLKSEVERYQKELETERATRVDADRYSRLLSLRQRYAFDVDREFERAKYGRMSDQQFAEFCEVVEGNFQPIPVGATLPTFDGRTDGIPGPGANGQPERYSREQSERAFKYCEAQRISGKPADYCEVLRKIKAGETLE